MTELTAETRQTVIGIGCLSAVMVVALHEGFNGRVTLTYILAVTAMVSPQALKALK